jgi:hypothetical protein
LECAKVFLFSWSEKGVYEHENDGGAKFAIAIPLGVADCGKNKRTSRESGACSFSNIDSNPGEGNPETTMDKALLALTIEAFEEDELAEEFVGSNQDSAAK